jgi:hypothetical protein
MSRLGRQAGWTQTRRQQQQQQQLCQQQQQCFEWLSGSVANLHIIPWCDTGVVAMLSLGLYDGQSVSLTRLSILVVPTGRQGHAATTWESNPEVVQGT